MRATKTPDARAGARALVVLGLALAGCTAGDLEAPGGRTDDVGAPGRQMDDVGGPGEPAPFANANLLLISVDTLRRDHLTPYGATFPTPTAAALAASGVLFEDATAHTPLTLPSHATMLTGLHPPRHGVRDNGGFVLSEEHRTLAESLRDAGYATAAFVASYTLDHRWGLAQGFDVYNDDLGSPTLDGRSAFQAQRPAAAVVDAALVWLQATRPAGRPFFLWVHLFDPHLPYEPPEQQRRRAPSAYAGEVLYADEQAGRLLAALDRLGVRDRTMIVYTSDHGEGLGEHGEPAHGVFLYRTTLDVPLIVAPPTADTSGALPPGLRVRGLARIVDLMPTVLELLGITSPENLDGASLMRLVLLARHDSQAAARANFGDGGRATRTAPNDADAAARTASPGSDTGAAVASGDPDRPSGPFAYAESYYARLHYGWSELLAIRSRRWKYIRAPRRELYDLEVDPGETDNLYATRPRLAAVLDAEIEALNPLAGPRRAPSPVATDPETEARLRSLGYLGSGFPGPPGRTRLDDPKDRMPLLLELQRAGDLEESGELDAADRILENLAARDPANPEVQLARMRVLLALGDYDGAIAAGRRGLELRPDDPTVTHNLAIAQQAAGRLDDAEVGFRRVLELDPGNVNALLNLGKIALARDDLVAASGFTERAAALAPDDPAVHLERARVALLREELDGAEAALHRALELGVAAPGLHFNLGLIAEQRGDLERAAREYRAEVSEYPGAFEAWTNLGVLERQRGRIDAALEAFESVAAARPNSPLGPFLVAETLAALGHLEEARRWAEEALARDPDDPRSRRLLERLRASR